MTKQKQYIINYFYNLKYLYKICNLIIILFFINGGGTTSVLGNENNSDNPLQENLHDIFNHIAFVNTNSIGDCDDIDAYFSVSDETGCSPYSVEFDNQSTGEDIEYYYWMFGDGSTSVEVDPVKTYINITDVDSIYTVELVAASWDFLCTDTFALDITVYPYVEAEFTVDSIVSCTPYDIEIMDNSINAEFYEWDFGDGSALSSSDDSIITHTYENTGTEVEEYTINQTVWLERDREEVCHKEFEKDITVYPEVIAEISILPGAEAGCAPYTVDFSSSDTENGSFFYWDFDDGATSSQADPIHTFENSSGETKEFEVMLVASWTEHSCFDTTYVTIEVHPEINAGFYFNPTYACNLHEVEFTNSSYSSSTIVSYHWDFDDGSDSDEETPPPHLYEHDEDTPQDYVIELAAETEEGCVDIATDTITIYPKVTADFDPIPDSGCSSLNVSFNNNSYYGDSNYYSGNLNYYWDFDDGSLSTLDEPVYTFENPVFEEEVYYNVTLIAESEYSCYDSANYEIEVFPSPKASFTVEQSFGCTDFEVTINNQSEGVVNYTWDFGDGTPVSNTNEDSFTHIYTNDTDTPVTYILNLQVENDYDCISEMSKEITVYPEVTAGFDEIENGCHPYDVQFINTTQNGDVYQWHLGDGKTSTEEEPVHTYLNFSHTDEVDFTAELYAESEYGCGNTYIQENITIFPKPLASFWVENPTGCSPNEVIIHNASEGGVDFYLDLDDGSDVIETNFATYTHTYEVDPGEGKQVFEIELEVFNEHGCSDVFTQNVTVYPDVVADFEIEGEDKGCSPFTVDFFNNSGGASGHVSYKWDYGDSNTSTVSDSQHSHTFKNYDPLRDTTYTVKLVAYYEDACSDTTYKEVTVLASPLADFGIDENKGCSPHDVVIYNMSIGNNLDYEWDFGDGGEMDYSENPSPYTYIQPAGEGPEDYTITLNVFDENGCRHKYQQNVTVYPEVNAAFDMDVTEDCHPLNVQFDNETEGGDDFLWDFGEDNQSSDENPSHVFYNYSNTEVLNRTITLYAESDHGCYAEHSDAVTIFPLPKADFAMPETSGCSPFSTIILDESAGNGLDYEWNFGNGTGSEEPPFTHTWINTTDSPIDYQILLTVTNEHGCFNNTDKTVNVYPEVTAEFTTIDEIFQDDSPLEVEFVNQSRLANTYNWNFGDGSASSNVNPSHFFNNTGNEVEEYIVTLEAISLYGCRDITERVFLVNPAPEDAGDAIPPPPVPVADFKSLTRGCAPVEIQFQNNSSHSNEYEWHFGDGIISKEEHPKYAFFEPGEHEVMLIAISDGGKDTAYTQISVFENPIADFEIESSILHMPYDSLHIINNSESGTYYEWNFGDGNYSSEKNPVHFYNKPGIYNISLTVYTDTDPQCLDKKVLGSSVRVEEACVILFPNAFKPDKTGPSGGTYNTNNPSNEIFYPLYKGIDEYVLEIYNRWGELIFKSDDPEIGWDGYHGGEIAQMDVYVWKVTGFCNNGDRINKSGDVTLIH